MVGEDKDSLNDSRPLIKCISYTHLINVGVVLNGCTYIHYLNTDSSLTPYKKALSSGCSTGPPVFLSTYSFTHCTLRITQILTQSLAFTQLLTLSSASLRHSPYPQLSLIYSPHPQLHSDTHPILTFTQILTPSSASLR